MTYVEEACKVSKATCGSENSPHQNFPVISDEARHVMEIIFFVAVIGTVSVFGLIACVINIIIFVKQGFHDSVNVSFCALAVSDLGSHLSLLWKSFCYNPVFRFSDIDFDSIQIFMITGAWPHSCFVKITSWITALITFERCVCIALPMKVKDIITRKRTFISVIVTSVVTLASVTPIFWSFYLAPLYQDQRNKTLFGLWYTSRGRAFENIYFHLNVLAQLCSVAIVFVCTITLIYNLQTQTQWRRKTAAVTVLNNSNSLSKREKKVVKMVTIIAVIFIVCFLPNAINLILMIHLSPYYSAIGKDQNAYHFSWTIINTFEAINCSATIIVYYKISSKFKADFNKLVCTAKNTLKCS